MERKLTAIFSADVKGYSRLMGDDEEATIRTLTAYREVMTTLIQQHRGRVVDSPGDNLLAEFASAVDAVQSAVEIQRELKSRNTELPDARKMEYRIGLNVGDVIVEGERLYGDGVNIAARLEGLAEPGGICVSGTVYDQVENKLALSYDYVGEQEVKNIAKPVRVYRILREPSAVSSDTQSVLRQAQHERTTTPVTLSPSTSSGQALSQSKGGQKRRAGFACRNRAMVAVAGLVLIAGAIITVRHLVLPTPNPQHPIPNTQSLPLPDKPSLVVLPFVNMSEDPKQDYFSDGLTEDLTGALSQIASLFVIARNSAFTYKGKAVKIQDVGKELGVHYVLEGSVRRANDQVRITAQLIEATTGYHLWSERYDRPLSDIFVLQDEVTQKIVLALKVKLTTEEQTRFQRTPTNNLEAYDYYLRGVDYYWRFTKETNMQARQMYEKALELDPQYAAAYASLGATHVLDWIWQWSQDPQTLELAFALTQKAIALDDSLPMAHSVLGWVYVFKKQHERAIAEGEQAITLAPNDAEGYVNLGTILNLAGRPEEAIRLVERAIRLNPRYPAQYLVNLGQAYTLTRQYEEAIAVLKRAITRNPNFLPAHLFLAVVYSESSREAEARAAAAEILRVSPHFSVEGFQQRVHYKDPAVLERFFAALGKAGLK